MPPRRSLGVVVMALSIMALMFFMMTPETSSLQVPDLKNIATKYQPGSHTDHAEHTGHTAPVDHGHAETISKEGVVETPPKYADAHIGDLPGEPPAPANHDAHQGDARLGSENHNAHGVVGSEHASELEQPAKAKQDVTVGETTRDDLSKDLVDGKPIMGKMVNQTARAQLGNAGWKLLHTILAQYPEKPDADARQTLETYLKLFSRVYPCRECAEHFQQLLADYPPQLSSRKTAVMWGCEAHNKVNRRLGKEIFDCAYISDKYDCGCGDSETEDEVDPNENKPKPADSTSHAASGHAAKDPAAVDHAGAEHAGADHAALGHAAVEKEVDPIKGG